MRKHSSFGTDRQPLLPAAPSRLFRPMKMHRLYVLLILLSIGYDLFVLLVTAEDMFPALETSSCWWKNDLFRMGSHVLVTIAGYLIHAYQKRRHKTLRGQGYIVLTSKLDDCQAIICHTLHVINIFILLCLVVFSDEGTPWQPVLPDGLDRRFVVGGGASVGTCVLALGVAFYWRLLLAYNSDRPLPDAEHFLDRYTVPSIQTPQLEAAKALSVEEATMEKQALLIQALSSHSRSLQRGMVRLRSRIDKMSHSVEVVEMEGLRATIRTLEHENEQKRQALIRLSEKVSQLEALRSDALRQTVSEVDDDDDEQYLTPPSRAED